jgi:histidine triad (HIT) family protein
LSNFGKVNILMVLMNKDCVFCKIVAGKIPAKIEKETEDLIVIHDINPKAPVHLLMIAKKHMSDVREDDGKVWEAFRKMAVELTKEKSLKGVRIVHNIGKAAMVKHMHVHFLGEVDEKREV